MFLNDIFSNIGNYINIFHAKDILHGITETMPISSTAHLIAFDLFAGIKFSTIKFSTINQNQINKLHIIHLHLATALSATLFLRDFLWKSLKSLFIIKTKTDASACNKKHETKDLSISSYSCIITDASACNKVNENKDLSISSYSCIIITAIQVLLSFPLSFIIAKLEANFLHTLYFISFGSIISGCLLYAANLCPKWEQNLSWKHIMPISLLQTLAFFPGVSRLGATLTALRTLGFDNQTAWQYSIALGIPLSAGASLLTYLKNPNSFSIDIYTFFIVFAISYLFYFISTKIQLTTYGIYKCIFGLIILVYLLHHK